MSFCVCIALCLFFVVIEKAWFFYCLQKKYADNMNEVGKCQVVHDYCDSIYTLLK